MHVCYMKKSHFYKYAPMLFAYNLKQVLYVRSVQNNILEAKTQLK